MYVSFKQMQFGPETPRCRLPPKIANCQINSIFHLAKHISVFSHICGRWMEMITYFTLCLRQMLDFIACENILNAGYISRNHTYGLHGVTSASGHIPEYFNLETQAFCRIHSYFVYLSGRILGHIWKYMQYYVKKKREKLKLISKYFSQVSLTWILREKSTTFAVDYFFDNSHFCGRWGRHQPQARYHRVNGGDASHHVEPRIKAWHTDRVCKAHKITFWLEDLKSVFIVFAIFL